MRKSPQLSGVFLEGSLEYERNIKLFFNIRNGVGCHRIPQPLLLAWQGLIEGCSLLLSSWKPRKKGLRFCLISKKFSITLIFCFKHWDS